MNKSDNTLFTTKTPLEISGGVVLALQKEQNNLAILQFVHANLYFILTVLLYYYYYYYYYAEQIHYIALIYRHLLLR